MQCLRNSRVYLETELEQIGEIALFFDLYVKIKVLQLIWVSYNLRPLLVRYKSPKEHRTLLLKLSHVSRLRNPKYFAPTPGEIVAVSTNVEIADKKIADLLLADEQLFQPYTYFSVTLYLHFHVVNRNN